MGCGDSKAAPASAPAPAPAPAPAAKKAAQPKKGARPAWVGKHFQVKLDNDWKDYDKETDVMITRAYLVGQPHCRFTLRGARYEMDFSKMLQINLDTGKERSIRAPPGMRPPKNPLLPAGPMIVVTVKEGQPGTAIMVPDPNNANQQIQVAVPKTARVGSKLAVPVPKEGEQVADVMEKQKGMSAGGKVALTAAGIVGLGAVAVGGVVLGDYLTGGDLGTEEMAADAAEAVTDAAEHAVDEATPVVEDAAEAVADAAEDAADWTADAAEDAAAWFEDVGDTIGDAVMDLF
mmetsp:Transcript_28686/g.66555  ORF Transcript_28686/g.66555 Transcript_28686/m.66555 type:complete len:290 (+) Transcript_28686:127-996(+)|eukprot:CAMPEP_0178420200 /NCGR_PEP_ID=MMETSP0689_2-20121128/26006_1 /TAXON_ID=160604 /ORGANISM="Amphidinium massartii, Strain CS-259" /LENGTH=289 /DNA_ID=CAMNT_0020041667 /DNA_START=126 /DNA_END=995 /DNA_ORIENTATION=-